MCRHAGELKQQADTAAAAAETAASEAAALTAKYDTTIAQLQQLLEQQGGAAGAQLAELHATAESQQQRLAGLTQQLFNLLHLPLQQQQQRQAAAQSLHQTYAASAAGAGSSSTSSSPVRSSTQQQQQWPGSPAASGTWSPSRLGTQQQQKAQQKQAQQQQVAALPADVQELCSALSAAVGAQSQPEDVAGAVQALVSGLTQVLLGLVGHAAALEAALAEAHAESEQLLADGTALAGRVRFWP